VLNPASWKFYTDKVKQLKLGQWKTMLKYWSISLWR
jgi:hypothetical protein